MSIVFELIEIVLALYVGVTLSKFVLFSEDLVFGFIPGFVAKYVIFAITIGLLNFIIARRK